MTATKTDNRRMGRKKNPPPASGTEPKPRPGYPVFARIDEELGAALEEFLGAQRYRPTLTTVLEQALKDLLEREGFWPKKKEGGGK